MRLLLFQRTAFGASAQAPKRRMHLDEGGEGMSGASSMRDRWAVKQTLKELGAQACMH
jgi:hypothetical protein